VLQQTQQRTSVITIVSPTSSKATRQRSLPFSLRQCVFYNHHFTPASAGFSLIGITADSVLVHVGDAVGTQVDPGDHAQPLNVQASHSSQPTLWQDIFGKSALLSGVGHVERLRDPVRNRNLGRVDWGILTEGGPSHLLPAAGALFEPLIESLLGIGEGHDTGHNRDQKKGHGEDVEMEDVQRQLLPRESTRDVTSGEIDMLVELFKGPEFTGAVWYYPGSACVDPAPPTVSPHCSSSSPATLKPELFTNGSQKPHRGKRNGIHPEMTSSHAPPSPVITPTRRQTRSISKSTIPSPVISTAEKAISSELAIKVGKKRKKSAVE
jgi:hypothetical protein